MKAEKNKGRRPTKKKKKKGPLCALAWFNRKQWKRLRQVAADPDLLDDTYEGWRAQAEKSEQALSAYGLLVKRIAINTDELVAWCEDQHVPIDSPGRATYATHKLRETLTGFNAILN